VRGWVISDVENREVENQTRRSTREEIKEKIRKDKKRKERKGAVKPRRGR